MEGPEECLEHLERVQVFNRCDGDETLGQVFFFLEDSARICSKTTNVSRQPGSYSRPSLENIHDSGTQGTGRAAAADTHPASL